MSKSVTSPSEPLSLDGEEPSVKGNTGAIAWAIFAGILFGAMIGAAVGIFLRPKQELTELSQEWLDELRDVTEHVSGTVRNKVADLATKRREPSERYEEYPGSYV